MRVLVVLGHRLNNDGTMSAQLQERLDETLKQFKSTPFDKIILSGGVANKNAKVSEASIMSDYLTAGGIPLDKQILEDSSLTTKENAKFCASILKELKVKEFWLLSSACHIQRKWLNPVKLFTKSTQLKINTIKA